MDSNFVAEEMELYDEIRSTMDHDELLIIMSRLQEHFLEKLAYQNEQRRLREEELKQFATTGEEDTDLPLTEITEDTSYTTNYDTYTEDEGTDHPPRSPASSIISAASKTTATSPINTFAYPDDDSNPFKLPSRSGSRKQMKQKPLTKTNLKSHDASTLGTTLHRGTSIPTSGSSVGSSRKYLRHPRRGQKSTSSLPPVKNGRIQPHHQISASGPPSPTKRSRANTQIVQLSSNTSAGAYRLGMFCERMSESVNQ